MREGYKCIYCPNCPYYESTTSYGTEKIKCENTDCIMYGTDFAEESDSECE